MYAYTPMATPPPPPPMAVGAPAPGAAPPALVPPPPPTIGAAPPKRVAAPQRMCALPPESSSDSDDSDDYSDNDCRLSWPSMDELQQPKTSEDENLTNLVHLQLADGSFKFGKALETLIKMTEQKLMENCLNGEDRTTWITAVSFVAFENFFPDKKDLWELVANKAKSFILKHAKNDFDEIIINVKTMLKLDTE